MRTASYKVVPYQGGWGVSEDGRVTGSYATKEAAFEAAVGPASNAIKLGFGVSISVEGGNGYDSVLSAK